MKWLSFSALPVIALTVMYSVAANAADKQNQIANAYTTQSLKIGQYHFEVSVQAGFVFEILTSDLEAPRTIHFHNDRLFIGSRSGAIYWLDPPYKTPHQLVKLNGYPHSIVVHRESIYVARTNGIYSAPYSSTTQTIPERAFTRVVELPGGRGHNSRTLKRGPDQQLYVSLGIAGNCSDQYLGSSYSKKSRRGGISMINLDAAPVSLEPYGTGLRNPVGFAWHPETDVLYATNNGPDHHGYNVPPEYFARVTENSFHGMPWFQFDGKKIFRDNCIHSKPPLNKERVSLPVATFPARSAPMDMVFLDKRANARQYIHDAIVAIHGSWATTTGKSDGDPASRRKPKLVRVEFSAGSAVGVTDLITGFQLANGARWLRPVGVALGPDGDIYFTSDDGIHGLYRLRYDP